MSAHSLLSVLAAPVAASGVAPASGAPPAEGEFGALLASMTGALKDPGAASRANTPVAVGRVSSPPAEAVDAAAATAEEVALIALAAGAALPKAAEPVPAAANNDTTGDDGAEAGTTVSVPPDAAPVLTDPVSVPVLSTPLMPEAPSTGTATSLAPPPATPAVPAASIATPSDAIETVPASGRPSGFAAEVGVAPTAPAAPDATTGAAPGEPSKAGAGAAVLALPPATPPAVVPMTVAPRVAVAPTLAASRPAAPPTTTTGAADGRSLDVAPVVDGAEAVATPSGRPTAAVELTAPAPASREPAFSVADRASGRSVESPVPGASPTPSSGLAPAAAQAQAAVQAAAPPPAPAPAPALESAPVAAAAIVEPATPPAPQGAAAASAPATAAIAGVTATFSTLSQTAIDATAQIAAQITRRLEGRSTRFEMALTPEGLGRVDVSLDIDADGQLSARLAFDNPLAATDLRSRADELRRQLEDAGFTLARDALDFAERDASSSGHGFDRRQGRAFAEAARRNDDADTAVPAPAAWISLSLTPEGVDMKV